MNEKVEPGVIMNALAHMCIGFGAEIGKEPLQLIDYIDADGGVHSSISRMPFMILKGNSNKIKALKEVAEDAGIDIVTFTDTMTKGSYLDQLERMKNTHEADLIYYGIVLFGDWAKVSELTKKFSLWKLELHSGETKQIK